MKDLFGKKTEPDPTLRKWTKTLYEAVGTKLPLGFKLNKAKWRMEFAQLRMKYDDETIHDTLSAYAKALKKKQPNLPPAYSAKSFRVHFEWIRSKCTTTITVGPEVKRIIQETTYLWPKEFNLTTEEMEGAAQIALDKYAKFLKIIRNHPTNWNFRNLSLSFNEPRDFIDRLWLHWEHEKSWRGYRPFTKGVFETRQWKKWVGEMCYDADERTIAGLLDIANHET